MKIGAIIQARMSSQRFPNKVLHIVNKKPVLEYLLDRLGKCVGIDKVIVASSADASDSLIEEYCKQRKQLYYRGSLFDVSARFKSVLELHQLDGFVRLSADSPLLDSTIIDKAVVEFRSGQFDLVTNVCKRTYPKGQSVEVLNAKVFNETYPKMRTADELEHVTKYFYTNKEQFRILNIEHTEDCHEVQLSVDTSEDMKVFERIISKMNRPHWEYRLDEILSLHREVSSTHI